MRVPVILNIDSAVRVIAGHPLPVKLDPVVAKHNAILHALGTLASEQRQREHDTAMKALDLLDYMTLCGYKFQTQWSYQAQDAAGNMHTGPWQSGTGPDPEVSKGWRNGVLYLRVLPVAEHVQNVAPVPSGTSRMLTTLDVARQLSNHPDLALQLQRTVPGSAEAHVLMQRARAALFPIERGEIRMRACMGCSFATPVTCNHPEEQPPCLG